MDWFVWRCESCTFDNEHMGEKCEVCGMSRRRAPPKVETVSSPPSRTLKEDMRPLAASGDRVLLSHHPSRKEQDDLRRYRAILEATGEVTFVDPDFPPCGNSLHGGLGKNMKKFREWR